MASAMSYQSLDPEKIIHTASRLEQRIAERFPERGLVQVAREVVTLGRTVADQVKVLSPPIWWLRVLIGLIVLLGAGVFVWVGSVIPLKQVGRDAVSSVQSIEAVINTLLLAILGLVTLVQLEARFKRQKVARGLHALRSVIHVIDMHQLTKDPVTLEAAYQPTPNSPPRDMDAVAMPRPCPMKAWPRR
jgi:hypothetical protein